MNSVRCNSDVGVRLQGRSLLLYDAECGLCDNLVRWVFRKSNRLCFAPLQGVTAIVILKNVKTFPRGDTHDSLVFLRGCVCAHAADDATLDKMLLRTDGVIEVLRELGGGWRVWATILHVIPRCVRDLGYRCVARVRRWFFGGVKSGEAVADELWARACGRFLP